MDVTFHEGNMYFHQTELQGEHYKEVQFFGDTDKEEISSIEVSPASTSSSPPATLPTEMSPSPDTSPATLPIDNAPLMTQITNRPL